jgi:hypothetical protein
MSTWKAIGAVVGVTALTAVLLPAAHADELACIGVSAQAIYRAFGYDHVVYLLNRCGRDAVCDVSTDVNPEPVHVAMPTNAAIEVLTFRGSPARTFTPRVSCRSAH